MWPVVIQICELCLLSNSYCPNIITSNLLNLHTFTIKTKSTNCLPTWIYKAHTFTFQLKNSIIYFSLEKLFIIIIFSSISNTLHLKNSYFSSKKLSFTFHLRNSIIYFLFKNTSTVIHYNYGISRPILTVDYKERR